MTQWLVCFYVFQIFLIPFTSGFFVWTEDHQQGEFGRVSLTQCSNLPDNLAGRVNSIHTQDTCARLYDKENCGGNSIELTSSSPYHEKLSYWDFSNKTVSLGPCRDICSEEFTSGVEPQDVQIFSEPVFDGVSLNITITNCTELPNFLANYTSSIKTFDQCVIIYDNLNCKPSQFGRESWLELRPGNKYLSDITLWAYKREAKAISYCSLHCGGTVHTNKPSLPVWAIGIIIAVPLIIVIIFVPLVYFILRKLYPQKFGTEMLSEKEIEEFRSGIVMDVEAAAAGNECGDGGGGEGGKNDYSVELLAQARPYNEAFEIARSQIKIDERSPLGMGEYGVVYRGSVQFLQENESGIGSSIKRIPIAIKTIKPGSGPQYLRSLMKEVKVMLFLGKNQYVVQMVGCCSEDLRKGSILVLMEFCPNGNLEAFLRTNQQAFSNILVDGKVVDKKLKENLYSNQIMSTFDVFQLVQWCVEVARGMEFLAMSKVIHSDLATRNVLLTENYRAKISDFGLSRQLYNYSNYVKRHQEPLPWRWMAIESLKRLEFSTESDVWSYGILCWEIFTLGEKPYQGLNWSKDFTSNLANGLRPHKPDFGTTKCYDLMLRCWSTEPKNRPTFTAIIEELTNDNFLQSEM